MLKVIATSALVLGLASSAFAQTSAGSDKPMSNTKDHNQMMMNSDGNKTDGTTTNSVGTTPGVSGNSAADQTEKCPAGSPGVGTQGTAPGDKVSKATNCQ